MSRHSSSKNKYVPSLREVGFMFFLVVTTAKRRIGVELQDYLLQSQRTMAENNKVHYVNKLTLLFYDVRELSSFCFGRKSCFVLHLRVWPGD